jgi:hypothetical protein
MNGYRLERRSNHIDSEIVELGLKLLFNAGMEYAIAHFRNHSIPFLTWSRILGEANYRRRSIT